MVLQLFVVGRSVNFGIHAAFKVSHLLGALVDEKHKAVALGMVFDHAVGDIVQNSGLTGAGRGDYETTGAFTNWAK